MNDTPDDVAARYVAMLLRLGPAARLAMVGRMFAAARRLSDAGREPGAVAPLGAGARRRRRFLRLYGADFSAAERERILDGLTAGGNPSA